jgi:Uma2 family endonuclease
MATTEQTVTDAERAAFASCGLERPPTQDELPETDGLPMDSERQALQMDLLFEPLRLRFSGRDVYVGKNQIIYYSIAQVRNRDFLGPDVLVVLDVPDRERKSWVVWEEGKAPDVVIEILSPTTADRDKGEKKRIYQDNIGVREYFWYDPETNELAGFVLHDRTYVPLEPDISGQLPCPSLGLALLRWDGVYLGREGPWLRWATPAGGLLPTGTEAERQQAEQERQRAEQERQRAEQERQRAQQAESELAEMRALLERYRERFGEAPP